MSAPIDIAARAIVVQIREHITGDALVDPGSVESDASTIAYLLTLTVMPEDELPFRSRVEVRLPADARWQVHVGAHVPVMIGAANRDVRLDTAALQTLYEIG